MELQSRQSFLVRKIGAGSVAKVFGLMYAIMGLLLGAIISVASMLGAAIGASQGEDAAVLGIFFGVGAVIILPIVYGGLGAIFGAIGALIYNVLAGIVGGFSIDLEARPSG